MVQGLVDSETFNGVGEIWGLDDEGEFNGVWGDIGVPNLWFMMGKPCLHEEISKQCRLTVHQAASP